MLAAMRRASSLVSLWVTARGLGSSSKIAERLPGRVAHDEAFGMLVDRPRRRETARGQHGRVLAASAQRTSERPAKAVRGAVGGR